MLWMEIKQRLKVMCLAQWNKQEANENNKSNTDCKLDTDVFVM